MKILKLLLLSLALTSEAAFALEFSGAPLTEQELYTLWGKKNCKTTMVNSASSKSAMPKVLAEYLNNDPSFREVKIINCVYKKVNFEFYLIQKKSSWVMFSAEAVVIQSKEIP